MDAGELARQTAADLHAQAVALGVDPWRPYEFAVAEARRRGLDIEAAAVGAAVLDGGRAVFVPRDRLILHENAGTLFDRAFLIAHELGHVELGDDPGDHASCEIDPARNAEPAPVGVDRVIDYGRRQRREVQMDLFAREFLLPRAVVRRLYLQDGLTANVIASRLGAPFDVVAQQLFDALLLPPISPAPPAKRIERPLNSAQRRAADHRGRAYILEAGPGTGKTQTLTGRVESLLAEGVDPRRILVLTFSNKAAREMAERIALKHKAAAAAIWGPGFRRRSSGAIGAELSLLRRDRRHFFRLCQCNEGFSREWQSCSRAGSRRKRAGAFTGRSRRRADSRPRRHDRSHARRRTQLPRPGRSLHRQREAFVPGARSRTRRNTRAVLGQLVRAS